MEPLPHGYTNRTLRHGRTVTKAYLGPDAAERRERELTALRALRGRIPVPSVVDSGQELAMDLIEGDHGQELIDAGRAAGVLRACGELLRRIHRIPPKDVLPDETGRVLVHGDYGPNNVLLDPATLEVVAVVDWEWTHIGDPIDDLAWCEWIVRAHHPRHVDCLGEFFDAYGERPAWSDRQREMLTRQRSLVDFSERWEPGGAATQLWRRRIAATETWTE